jgi:hypothetical protein
MGASTPACAWATSQPVHTRSLCRTCSSLGRRPGSQRWSSLGFPYPVRACGGAALVAVSKTSELLVDATSTYPVLRTTDRGVTWHDVAIPRRPGLGGITVLPDGSLLTAHGLGYEGRWELLRRGARRSLRC